jgi:hypothetical protein
MNAKVDQIAKNLEAAKTAYHQGLDSLKNNGRSVFAPDEEARRRNELTATYQAAQRVAQDELQSAIAEAEQDIAASGASDPLAQLLPTELDKAARLREFLREDWQRLPPETLAQRAQDAFQRRDKAEVALHYRYAQAALEGRFERDYSARQTLQGVLASLEGVLIDVRKRDDARQTIDAAGRLQISMATAGYLERTYGSGAVSQVA